MRNVKNYFVYMITNWTNTVLYIGVTSDLEKKMAQQYSGALEGFTKKYNLKNLVFYEMYDDAETAISREKQLKRWRRKKKDFLVEKANPHWINLYEDGRLRSLDCARDDRIGS